MEIKIKKFEELSNRELFEIFKLRSEVFVVEQECPYQDIDDIDLVSSHVCIWDQDQLIAVARTYEDKEFGHIGRVLSKYRGSGLGKMLMKASIDFAKKEYKKDINIEAQAYAKGFYEEFGFVQTSEEFLDVGIPHIKMKLSL